MHCLFQKTAVRKRKNGLWIYRLEEGERRLSLWPQAGKLNSKYELKSQNLLKISLELYKR
jgi:hypothetical protein